MENFSKKKNQAMRLGVILGISVVIVLICIGGAVKAAYRRVEWNPADFTVTQAALGNPYCGWYQMYGYMLSDEEVSVFDARTKDSIEQSAGDRLVLLEVNLKQFSDRDLTQAALAQLEHIFSLWSESRCALIVRFLYDWDGTAASSEPDTRQQIERHMQQAAQVVNDYPALVYLVQGIFVGNYGEMHHSAYLSEEDMTQLTLYLRECLDSGIYMAVRTPAQLRTVLGSPQMDNAFKIGLFNDGMMGSDTDLGTYGTQMEQYTDSTYTQKGNRQQELFYQENCSLYAPSGGETVADTVYNDIGNAVSTLRQMHVSYLNRMYDEKVLAKWKNQSYEGIAGYDYIAAHLGYRYELPNADCTYQAFQQAAQLEIAVRNTGFAPAYRDFTVGIAVCDAENTVVWQENLSEEFPVTEWYPEETVHLNCKLPVYALGKGNFTVYLKITDRVTKEQIHLAVIEAPTENGYLCGNIEIR